VSLAYEIFFDNGKPIYLVGTTTWNTEVYDTLKYQRKTEIISMEDLETKSKDDLENHQYFCNAGFVGLKKNIVDTILKHVDSPNFVSLVSNQAVVHKETKIGKGVLVCPTALIPGPCDIGDFCTINHFTMVGHGFSKLGSFVFTGAYVNIGNCDLAEGTWVGSSSKLDRVKTVPYCQFYMNSRVKNQDIATSGTYKNTKMLKAENSLQLDIN
jgi:acetyltransferase-like isoleucine patch superfamily enzyme|tara:strand:- start:852 stop:1487 length:636 start_codon:yes stop_codon:yes gene_type:complete